MSRVILSKLKEKKTYEITSQYLQIKNNDIFQIDEKAQQWLKTLRRILLLIV